MSTSKHDEYRRKAEDAKRHADRTSSQEDKASWLRIAEGWLSLLPRRKTVAHDRAQDKAAHGELQEQFDDHVRARRTRLTDSGVSH